MENKIKVIILYNKLLHYRIPVWNELAKRCDLTVAYSQGDSKASESFDCNFKFFFLPVHKLGGRLVLQKGRIRKIVKDYDVVVAYGNIAWLKYSTLPWFSHTKVVYHAIGVSASYSKGFDQNRNWDKIRAFFYKQASALAFYTDYPIEKYVKLGIPRERIFVAPNTVKVEPAQGECERDSILMMGTLYREKGVQVLLDAYLALKDVKALPILNIVGGGPDYDIINQWVFEHGMTDIIRLAGPVYDIKKKAEFFARAIACVSPRQAGLTVLESMGYGVPFVTMESAITGGELLNIHNGVDGVIMNDESEMVSVIRDISDNRDKYIEMGRRAKKFYDDNRTVKHMADGLWDAILFANNS